MFLGMVRASDLHLDQRWYCQASSLSSGYSTRETKIYLSLNLALSTISLSIMLDPSITQQAIAARQTLASLQAGRPPASPGAISSTRGPVGSCKLVASIASSETLTQRLPNRPHIISRALGSQGPGRRPSPTSASRRVAGSGKGHNDCIRAISAVGATGKAQDP